MDARLDAITDQVRRISVEVDEARHALSATVERAMSRAERALAEAPPLSEEEVEAFETACTTGAVAPAWQNVVDRIERDEFSWRDIAEGRLSGDPAIADAIRQATQLARQAHAGERGRADDSDDDYFENFSYSRDSD